MIVSVLVIARSKATKQSIGDFPQLPWIASRSLSSGVLSRDPLARNDDQNQDCDTLRHQFLSAS
jgi:hypothetical protein